MFFAKIVSLFIALQVPLFVKSLAPPPDHPWQAPGEGDVRSPCPGLNTLANHGYLPRNGKNITTNIVLTAIFDGFHMEREAMILAAHLALLTTASEDTFTLETVRLHNTIEHDVSLSRQDIAQGDNFSFNATIFETLANSNPGVDYYNTTSAGQVMKQRLTDQQKVNPGLLNTSKQFFQRAGESALYLTTMGDPDTGVAPKEFVQIFFKEERFPFEEGWKQPEKLTTGAQIGVVSQAIADSAEWPGPGPGEVTPSIVIVVPPNSTVVF